MTTHKKRFGGSDSSIDMDDKGGRSHGLERMVQDEIAQQVANALRNI